MLAGLDKNPVVEFLGNENDAKYLREAIWFFFILSVVQGTGAKRKDLVACLGLTFFRAFGDLNIALAMGLGGMPGDVFRSLDMFMQIVCAAVAFAWFSDQFVPVDLSKYVDHVSSISYSIIKGNNAGIGYAAVAAALPGSFWGPLMGAYLGVNGARLLERGIGSLRNAPDNDDVLAIMAGAFIYITTTHMQASALLARALLVAFSYSQNYIDWQAKWNDFTAQVGGGGRGRSSTPKKK